MESSLSYQQCDLPTAIPWCLSWDTSTFLGHTCYLPQNSARTPSMPDTAHQVSHAHNDLSVKIKLPFFFKKVFQSLPQLQQMCSTTYRPSTHLLNWHSLQHQEAQESNSK